MDKLSKLQAYEKYSTYFRYNYQIDLPPLADKQTTNVDITMMMNANVLISVLTGMGVQFAEDHRYEACCKVKTFNGWTNLENFVFEIDISRLQGKTLWSDVAFNTGIRFNKLVPAYNEQSKSTCSTISRTDDDKVDQFKPDIDPFELFKAYNNQIDSIGGEDVLGILDI
jgi:hypothetical protein